MITDYENRVKTELGNADLMRVGLSRADQELMLNRFRRLLAEIASGSVTRNCFQRWEIDLLLDLDACPLRPRDLREVLAQYQRAVERQFDKGADAPLKFSEFLSLRQARHAKS
jgi:hypothetical protein